MLARSIPRGGCREGVRGVADRGPEASGAAPRGLGAREAAPPPSPPSPARGEEAPGDANTLLLFGLEPDPGPGPGGPGGAGVAEETIRGVRLGDRAVGRKSQHTNKKTK